MFYDSLLWRQNSRLAEELFDLEMKLRRVLSLIYLHYSSARPYELLRDDCVQLMKKEKPTAEQMHAAVENEFFHLTFGQYPGLNQRKLPAKIDEIVPFVRDALSFESFRTEICRLPVNNEDDRDFISGLAEALGTVEKVRNSIAHNRTVPKKTLADYEKIGRPALERLISIYLERFAIETIEEDYATQCARRAVEQVMAEAEWDETAQTITIDDRNGQPVIFRTRDELEQWLGTLAETEWCGHAPRIDGEYVGLLDNRSLVSEILEPHKERLDKIFGEEK